MYLEDVDEGNDAVVPARVMMYICRGWTQNSYTRSDHGTYDVHMYGLDPVQPYQ